MEDLVDVLIATYNTEKKYLEKQIQSILKQTYKNLQIYISDDCSTKPEVQEILKDFAKKDKRIKLFLQPQNIGYNKNFEFLLNQSTANYIAFSDHDDIWYLDKIEKSLKKLKKENVDMVYCNCRQINENGIVLKENYFKYKNVPLINKNGKLAISRCVGIGCSQIITKEVKQKMIPFKKEVIAHDWLAGFIANEGKGITYIKEPLFDYRLHNSNVFGGRSLSQNLNRWKEKNGKSFEAFFNYRKDAIQRAYESGIKMCLKYSTKKENQDFCKNAENYYKKIYKTKIINLTKIQEYFKILNGRNIGKKKIREIILFHFPIIAYFKFIIT